MSLPENGRRARRELITAALLRLEGSDPLTADERQALADLLGLVHGLLYGTTSEAAAASIPLRGAVELRCDEAAQLLAANHYRVHGAVGHDAATMIFTART